MNNVKGISDIFYYKALRKTIDYQVANIHKFAGICFKRQND